ncbi:GlcG/HbpS family heme-binding protein [Oceanomicrobium pacificus]|uniref:Heme-binding protein n=1 Tax=Oceanomicrobium pacificus TaxID=2692916 RepID=A0A6B0TWR4_9RHOB|nr:heme-binding protein [Oceanomicrobium pacificus]MXU65453.1 heme-binding protein [Oceanomicrobium pacificus]
MSAALTLAEAKSVIAAVQAHGRAERMEPLSVLVLDAGGHPLAFERGDGTPPGHFTIAQAKAHGCLMIHAGGTAIEERAAAGDPFMQAAPTLFGGRFVACRGGMLILRDGTVVGALGVTGDTSENDLAAGLAGLDACGFGAEG